MRDFVEQVKALREGAEWAEKLCAHETAKRQSDAADAIEELQRLKTTDTIYGYPVNELIAFATACRENDVDEKDLKTFANNARFAFEVVHAETEAAFQRAIHGVGGLGGGQKDG